MGKIEIEQFLTYLAITKNVSPSTQNQAFNAILFLYTRARNTIERSKYTSITSQRKKHIPAVLGHKSVETTMIYTHIVKELNKNYIKSPLDF